VGRAASKNHVQVWAARQERIDELAKVARTKKDGYRLTRLCRRKLAINYAFEKVDATRKEKGSPVSDAVAAALNKKFQEATDLYITGQRNALRFKRRGDSISLQMQVTKTSSNPLVSADCVNLEKIAGKLCGKVNFIAHRPIPVGTTIKQVAVAIRNQRMYVVFMIEGPEIVLCRKFPSVPGEVIGIDPGLKCALAVSSIDGRYQEAFNPPIRNEAVMARLARLQRKADRQQRLANPDCYDEKGVSIKGKRAYKTTKNLERTRQQIAKLLEHNANSRLDFYHKTGNHLLTHADTIGLGAWRHKGGLGRGKSRKATNRKALEHAHSTFAHILRYKAEGTGKKYVDVPEAGTTRTCGNCGAETGPTGREGLALRKWTCSKCGTMHDRDFSSAKQIASKAIQLLTDKSI
jgi:transposase